MLPGCGSGHNPGRTARDALWGLHDRQCIGGDLLWAAYKPYELWYPFAAVGFASAVLMLVYAWWVKKYESADV